MAVSKRTAVIRSSRGNTYTPLASRPCSPEIVCLYEELASKSLQRESLLMERTYQKAAPIWLPWRLIVSPSNHHHHHHNVAPRRCPSVQLTHWPVWRWTCTENSGQQRIHLIIASLAVASVGRAERRDEVVPNHGCGVGSGIRIFPKRLRRVKFAATGRRAGVVDLRSHAFWIVVRRTGL